MAAAVRTAHGRAPDTVALPKIQTERGAKPKSGHASPDADLRSSDHHSCYTGAWVERAPPFALLQGGPPELLNRRPEAMILSLENPNSLPEPQLASRSLRSLSAMTMDGEGG